MLAIYIGQLERGIKPRNWGFTITLVINYRCFLFCCCRPRNDGVTFLFFLGNFLDIIGIMDHLKKHPNHFLERITITSPRWKDVLRSFNDAKPVKHVFCKTVCPLDSMFVSSPPSHPRLKIIVGD